MKTFNGGAAANVALVGANLGLKTSLVSAVGGDFKKSNYYEIMESLDVDTDSLIIVPGETSPTAFVLTDENDDQISYFYWGAAKEFASSKVPKNAISNVQAVHLATGDPHFNWKCSEEAKRQELLVSFDPGQDLGMYDTDKLRDVITNTTILFGNHYEIERILESLEVDLDGLREIGPKIIVKTCGANGSEIYSNNDKIKVDAACGVGKQQLFRAQHAHQPGGKHHVLHGVALIIMDAALHDDYRNLIYIAEDKAALVSGYGRHRKSLDVMIADFGPDIDALCVIPQSGSQNQRHFRLKICFLPNTSHTVLQFLHCFAHRHTLLLNPVLFHFIFQTAKHIIIRLFCGIDNI